VLTTHYINIRPSLPQFLSHERGLNTVKRSQKTKGELVYPHPYCGTLFNLEPGMSGMEVIALRDSESFDIENVNRTNHRVHDVLIMKILVEVAVGTPIVMGARPE